MNELTLYTVFGLLHPWSQITAARGRLWCVPRDLATSVAARRLVPRGQLDTLPGILLLRVGSIVAVHEGVHAVVHHHEPAAGGGELYIGVPSKP